MDDFYVEQVVARKSGAKESIIKTGISLLIGVLVVGGLFLRNTILMGVGAGVAVVGFIFIIPALSVEFEYLYLTRELSVDKILSKEKRKKAGNWDLRNMEIMAPINSVRLREYENRQSVCYDFSSHENPEGCYVILINDEKFSKIIFEPNEELLKGIRGHFPRQVFID